MWTKIFLDQTSLYPNFFSDPKFLKTPIFGPAILLDPKKISNPKFIRPQIFQTQLFFLQIHLFHHLQVKANKKNSTNKTWSSVSNSSLSKTFALCQFIRKLKVQKFFFLPPNIVLGLEKNEYKNYFGSEENFGSEKNYVQKKIWF